MENQKETSTKTKTKIYRVYIRFKSGRELTFDVETKRDLREDLGKGWIDCKKEGIIPIGDYLINTDEVLYIRISEVKP